MGYPRRAAQAARHAILVSLFVPLLVTLTTKSASAAAALLTWTTPGDTGGSGRIAMYDLRVSTKVISGTDTLSWWRSATAIPMSGKLPATAGSPDSILVAGLVMGAHYYAILRSADATPNWSAFSNVASFVPSLVTGAADGDQAPAVVLSSPRPSPTSGRTEVSLDLPKAAEVEAHVFNAQGRLVRTLEGGSLGAGHHVLRWDGRFDGGGDAASGVYWIRVAAGKTDKRVKLIVVR